MIHKGTGQTRRKEKRELSDEIERQTAEYLARKSKIQAEDVDKTKVVGLTWRNYAQTAMEDVE